MLRWMKTLLAVACWSFLLVGSVGLAEGISQWLRFDLLGGQVQPFGPVRLLVPYLVLYGWFGLLCGVLVFLPAALLTHLRTQPRRLAFTFAATGALASLAVIYTGYLGNTHLWPEWWEARGGVAVTLASILVWCATVFFVFLPCRRLADWIARQKTRTLVFPVLVIIVSTALWPDWRQEGYHERTDHLRRAAQDTAIRAGAPNLVLITIDTWRRDHLSLTHATAPPTPQMDALAQEGILWANAWSVSPWTLPSMATIMTGQPPRVLNVHQYVPLPAAVPNLAEVAWAQGYHTTAFATNPYLTEWYGFDRGFEFFEHALVIETLLPAERSVLSRELHRYAASHYETNNASHVVERVVRWLQWRRNDAPLLLWIHFMNPHLPYCWREIEPRRAVSSPSRGREPQRAAIPESDWFADGRYRGVMHIRNGNFVPDAQEKGAIRTLYAREVQFTDHWLGRLFAELKRHGLWENSVVAILSDHGEEFWEHGGFEHGHSVMPEVSGVPWIMRLPGGHGGGSVVDTPVTLLDVMPTLCALMGWPAPPELPGRPLLDPRGSQLGSESEQSVAVSADPAAPARGSAGSHDNGISCIENLLYGPQERALLRWPWFCIKRDDPPATSWYDLSADPGAQHPLSPPREAAHLLSTADSLLASWDRRAAGLSAAAAPESGEIPPDLRRRLEALGY